MDREIKFRAWDRLGRKMVKIFNIDFKHNVVQVDNDGVTYLGELLSLFDFELMQYTGIKDNNGKEIYEGDILFSVNENGIFIQLIGFGESGREYDEFLEGFKIIKGKMINCDQDFSSLDDKIKEIIINKKIPYENSEIDDFLYDGWWVIGNIYENPELLEVME